MKLMNYDKYMLMSMLGLFGLILIVSFITLIPGLSKEEQLYYMFGVLVFIYLPWMFYRDIKAGFYN